MTGSAPSIRASLLPLPPEFLMIASLQTILAICLLIAPLFLLPTMIQSWEGVWNGKEFIIHNYLLYEELLIDGILVEKTSRSLRYQATLRASLIEKHTTIPVTAMIKNRFWGLSTTVQLFVGGNRVALTPRTSAQNLRSEPYTDILFGKPLRAPSDPRWKAAKQLLEDIRQHTPGQTVADTCSQAERQIFSLLIGLEDLHATADAHHILDGHQGQGEKKLERACLRQEKQIQEIFQVVQELHIACLPGRNCSGDTADLIARLQTEIDMSQISPRLLG